MDKPRVDDILKVKFERVQGEAYRGAVLDIGLQGSWCDHSVLRPAIDFDGKLFRMWFVGQTKTLDSGVPYGIYERIGLAVSADGIRWKVGNDGRPVFGLARSGNPDRKGVSHPFVLRSGDKYMMWYGFIDGRLGEDIGHMGSDRRVERIGLVAGYDGIHWEQVTDEETVLDVGPLGSIDSIQATGMHVIKKDDTYIMWYGAYNGRHQIGIATSTDGIHWEKANGGQPVSGLIGEHVLRPSVYFDGCTYLMFYGRRHNKRWTMFAAISTDGVNWQPAWDDQPLLGPPHRIISPLHHQPFPRGITPQPGPGWSSRVEASGCGTAPREMTRSRMNALV